MRTVRRQVRELNTGKRSALVSITQAYAREKQHWLGVFERADSRHLIKLHRKVRDAALATSYQSKAGLQARMWKLALTDAAETWDRYWKALFIEVRSKIGGRKDFTEPMRHYAFWLLSGYEQFFRCMDGQAPAPRFKIDTAVLPKVASYVHQTIENLRGQSPTVKRARSFVLDSSSYTLVTQGNVQYLKIMTLERGKRLVLPLLGHAHIQGNIRIVVDGRQVAVHVSQSLQQHAVDNTVPEVISAVDFGYTEAMVDTDGNVYGTDLGRLITAASNERNETGKARNKLRALAERYECGNSKKRQLKARHIRRFNLGKVKWIRRENRSKASISCEINTALNQLVAQQQPTLLATESLRHTFEFDKPRAWNRKLSAWTKGVLQDRVEFKALAEGFRHQQVNPAYGSQACPVCDFVDSKNRNGDRFMCLHCKLEGHADRIAAMNILSRLADHEITLYTPYREVKAILLGRFHRRLEAEGVSKPDVTVPGRTSETVTGEPHRLSRRKSQRGDRKVADPAVNRRAKQSESVSKTVRDDI